MLVKCQTITSLIEKLAPRKLAEEWDNVGLLVGNPAGEISAVLLALDVTPEVVREAVTVGANLIISHHPLVFRPLKNIREDNPQGQLISNIIRNGIHVYCAHTNLDNAGEGVNQILARKLGLNDIQVLNPDKPEKIYKLVVFIPDTHVDLVRDAITAAGAGWIGNYSDCTFSTHGTGTFKASDNCKPFIGKPGVLEKASEIKLETVVKENQIDRVVRAMLKAHPYEEVAYDVYPLVNDAGRLGMGRIGRLEKPLVFREFMDMVKAFLNVPVLRYGGDSEVTVKKIAVCGGSGASFIHKAVFAGADVLVTGDLKYHEAQDALSLGLAFVDAGHYATEVPVIAALENYLKKNLVLEGISVPVFVSGSSKDSFSFF